MRRAVGALRLRPHFNDSITIAVRFSGDEVGYLERSVARPVAPEMDAGIEFQASADTVQKTPVLTIEGAVVGIPQTQISMRHDGFPIGATDLIKKCSYAAKTGTVEAKVLQITLRS